jgi:hypothetical protein
MTRNVPISVQLRWISHQPMALAGIVALALAAVALLVVYGAVWWPLARDAAMSTSEMEALERNVRELRSTAALAEEYARLDDVVDSIARRLDTDVTHAALSRSLGDLSSSAGVVFLNEASREGKPVGNLQVIRQEFGIETNYAGLREFLGGLDALPFYTHVDACALARTKEKNDLIVGKIELVTFRPASK